MELQPKLSPLSPDEFIEHTQVPGETGLFVLGCFDRRVTVYSQQVRALNLISALFTTKRLKQGDRVIVVGAGAAGATAAAAAAIRGCPTRLLDEKRYAFWNLRLGDHRWLHPHIYEWPQDGCGEQCTKLGVFDWHAGNAKKVGEQLETQLNHLAVSFHGRLILRYPISDVIVPSQGRSDTERVVSWVSRSKRRESRGRVVILAPGFGIEREIPGVSKSYWQNDNIEGPDPYRTVARYLISGTGDGGLIDVLRARLQTRSEDFRHHELLDFVPDGDSEVEMAKRQLQEIEYMHPMSLEEEYRSIETPRINARIKDALRTDTQVVLNGRGESPITPKASILNRFLVSRLLEIDSNLEWQPGSVKNPDVPRNGEPFRVEIEGLAAPIEADHVVFRHGPEKRPIEGDSFAAVSSGFGYLKKKAEQDRTRFEIFDPGDFKIIETPRRREESSHHEAAQRLSIVRMNPLEDLPGNVPDLFCVLFDEVQEQTSSFENDHYLEGTGPSPDDVASMRKANGGGEVPAWARELLIPRGDHGTLTGMLYVLRAIDESYETFFDDELPSCPRMTRLEKFGTLSSTEFGWLVPCCRRSVANEILPFISFLRRSCPQPGISVSYMRRDREFFRDQREVRLGFVPSLEPSDIEACGDEVCGLGLKHAVGSPGAVVDRIRNAIEQAERQDIDLLLAPKLAANRRVLDEVQEHLSSLLPMPTGLRMVLMGGRYDNGAETHSGALLLDRSGEVILRQEESRRDDESGSTEHNITLCDTRLLGRLAVMVGDDLEHGTLGVERAKELGVQVLINPAMESSLKGTWIDEATQNHAKTALVRSIVANSFASSNVDNSIGSVEIGLVRGPQATKTVDAPIGLHGLLTLKHDFEGNT